jgi:hypothetical protein
VIAGASPLEGRSVDRIVGHGTIRRMDHVGIVLDDLADAVAFVAELGLQLEGETKAVDVRRAGGLLNPTFLQNYIPHRVPSIRPCAAR